MRIVASDLLLFATRTPASRRHLAPVEIVLAVSLLLLLTFGLIEYAWLFSKAQLTAAAADHGARIGASLQATTTDVTEAVALLMEQGRITPDEYTITLTPDDPSAVAPGELFKVEVVLKYDAVGLGIPLVPVPAAVKFASSMAKESR